jgi:hypothetical protein
MVYFEWFYSRGEPNATELVKKTLILSPKLLFFKEGGSEENPLFQKSVVSSEGLSPYRLRGGFVITAVITGITDGYPP